MELNKKKIKEYKIMKPKLHHNRQILNEQRDIDTVLIETKNGN